MKLIKVDSCVSCPFCLDTVNLCRSYPKKYKCQKTFIGIDAKYAAGPRGSIDLSIGR